MCPFKFNPITWKLDMVNSTTWLSSQPQSGLASPEWAIASRYAWDMFINTATGITYINPTASSTTGWEIFQTSPSP